jgi:hypothetical protein
VPIIISQFLFWVLHPVSCILSRLQPEPSLATAFKMFNFILLLHVSVLLGHLQVEYTTISGSYFTNNGSVVLLLGPIYCICLVNTAMLWDEWETYFVDVPRTFSHHLDPPSRHKLQTSSTQTRYTRSGLNGKQRWTYIP